MKYSLCIKYKLIGIIFWYKINRMSFESLVPCTDQVIKMNKAISLSRQSIVYVSVCFYILKSIRNNCFIVLTLITREKIIFQLKSFTKNSKINTQNFINFRLLFFTFFLPEMYPVESINALRIYKKDYPLFLAQSK